LTFFKRDDQLDVSVPDVSARAERIFPAFVAGLPDRVEDIEIGLERGSALEIQAQRRIGQDRDAFVRDAVVCAFAREERLR